MAMADLLPMDVQRANLAAEDRYLDSIAELIAQGKRPNEIAAKIHPTDLHERRKLRRRLWHTVRHDDRLAIRIAAIARGEMMLSLVPATIALGKRASRGRPDAIKLLYESSGFHNPRVKHEHTGSIEVKMSAPRPTFDQDVVDADVVED